MPPGFQFAPFWATRAQMWTPLVLDSRVQDRGGRSLRVFARLKPGVSLKQAQQDITKAISVVTGAGQLAQSIDSLLKEAAQVAAIA